MLSAGAKHTTDFMHQTGDYVFHGGAAESGVGYAGGLGFSPGPPLGI